MSDFKPAREPIFNFSEKAPVLLAGFLILAYAIDSFAPGGLQTVFRQWGLLAAVDGSVNIDRGDVPAVASLLFHGLLHGDWGHVLVNSFMIAVFGVVVVKAGRLSGPDDWRGPARFVVIFALSVIAGGLAQWAYWIILSDTESAVGASGGASGLFAAMAWVSGGKERLLKFGVGWAALNLILVVAGNTGIMPNQIAWAAHMGGYVGGAILAMVMLRPGTTPFEITR